MKREQNSRKRYVWRRPTERGDALILIGMPGCGKSTLGKRLARRYQKPFIDVDDVLSAQEGRSVADLAASLPYRDFVRKESRAVCSIKDSKAIIATGGSVIYSPKSMEHLSRLGTIVYLQKPHKETRRRAGDPRKRGIVIPPRETYRTYQTQRHRLYRRYADIIYETANTTVFQSLIYLQALLEFVDPDTFVVKPSRQQGKPRPRRNRSRQSGSDNRQGEKNSAMHKQGKSKGKQQTPKSKRRKPPSPNPASVAKRESPRPPSR